MITDIEDYFSKGCGRCDRFGSPDCSTRTWMDGLTALRRVCREAGLEEVVKWAHPCYMHAGRNICIIGAFRDNFRLTFMNAALMTDPHGVLERQGANSRHPDMIRFSDPGQPEAMEPVIRAYLAEAMDYAEKGIRPEKTPRELELPAELVAALDDDPALAEAFHALTPGRRRSYVLKLNSAKQATTRVNRIARFRDGIMAGKGATER